MLQERTAAIEKLEAHGNELQLAFDVMRDGDAQQKNLDSAKREISLLKEEIKVSIQQTLSFTSLHECVDWGCFII